MLFNFMLKSEPSRINLYCNRKASKNKLAQAIQCVLVKVMKAMLVKKVVSDQTKVKNILRELDRVNLFKNKPNILKRTEKLFKNRIFFVICFIFLNLLYIHLHVSALKTVLR